MIRWSPSQIWQGEDAYVVGGGPSLRTFDWDLLRGKNTIGCNSAFLKGEEFIKITVFADYPWWEKIGKLKGHEYKGIMVASCPRLETKGIVSPDWLRFIPRLKGSGLGKEELGFNGNSGSLALNLALILGAKRVFLLGFDMKLGRDKEPNWHDWRHCKGSPTVYRRFMIGFLAVAKALPTVFPGREVYNVSDDTELDAFPVIPTREHWGRDVFIGEKTHAQ